MRGRLLTPIRTITSKQDVLGHLVDAFTKKGHVIIDSIIKTSDQAVYTKDEEQLLQLYKKLQGEVKTSDFLVAEISEPSSGIGYLISQAVAEKKPVLVLMKEDTKGNAPLPLTVGDNKYIHFETYKDIEPEIEEIVARFLNKMKDIIDTKFILIISPDIDKYLEWASQERRMHKAQLVREAIEGQMNKDKEYQQFLKDL